MFLSNVKSVPEVAEMIILVKLVEVDQVRPVLWMRALKPRPLRQELEKSLISTFLRKIQIC